MQFFFTAPVTRRALLNYKLLRPQLGLLFGVGVASLFSGAATASGSGRWSFVLGGWLLFAVIVLHALGANLTKASFRAPASKVPWLAWASAAVMMLVSGALLGSLAARALRPGSRPPGEALRALLEASRSGVAAAGALAVHHGRGAGARERPRGVRARDSSRPWASPRSTTGGCWRRTRSSNGGRCRSRAGGRDEATRRHESGRAGRAVHTRVRPGGSRPPCSGRTRSSSGATRRSPCSFAC